MIRVLVLDIQFMLEHQEDMFYLISRSGISCLIRNLSNGVSIVADEEIELTDTDTDKILRMDEILADDNTVYAGTFTEAGDEIFILSRYNVKHSDEELID